MPLHGPCGNLNAPDDPNKVNPQKGGDIVKKKAKKTINEHPKKSPPHEYDIEKKKQRTPIQKGKEHEKE